MDKDWISDMNCQAKPGPVLILVSGAPASGKTHLAERLSHELGIPAIHKDAIKETLFDTLGVGDREWSRRLGRASWALLYNLIDGQLAAGRSIIAEANFYPGDSGRIRALQVRHQAKTVEVNCTASPDVLRSRYAERSMSHDRHAGHADDGAQVERLDTLVRQGFFGPLDLDSEVVVVDTTDFSQVDYEAIAVSIRSLPLQV